MRSKRAVLAGLLAAAWLCPMGVCATASAQTLGFRFWGGTDGLPQLSLLSMAVDRDGLLWVGTESGLARFDGEHFRSWNIRDGLESDDVLGIAPSPDGSLFLITRIGLIQRTGDQFKTLHRYPPSAMRFRRILVDGPSVWVGGEGGLARWDGAELVSDATIKELAVTDLLRGPDGAVWVAGNQGLFRIEAGRPVRLPWLTASVDALAFDPQGRVVVATEGEVRRFDRGTLVERFSLSSEWSNPTVDHLHVDRKGAIWVGGVSGLIRIESGRVERIERSRGFPYFEISTILEDGDGLLWFAAFGALAQLTGPAFTRYDANEGLGADAVRPILRDAEGTLWVGTINGLGRLEGSKFHTFHAKDGLTSPEARALATDGSALWVGTNRGLFVREGDRFREAAGFPWKNPIFSLAFSADHSLWATVGRTGLVHGRDGSFTIVPVPKVNASGGRLMVDHLGRLWVTGMGGLARFDGQTWAHWSTEDGLADPEPRMVAEGPDGSVWLGYASGHGLTRFDGKTFRTWTVKDGLSHDAVYSIGVDSTGAVWAGTAQGVDHFDGHRFRNYSVREGYPSSESNGNGFWRDSDGTLWFGTAGGLAHYDPRADIPLDSPPTVSLAHVTTSADSPGHLLTQEVRADVIVPTYVNPAQLELEYRIGDDAWLPLMNRDLRLELPAGHWTIGVRAKRYHGPWSAIAQTSVELEPPIWARWWFISLSVLGLVGLGGAFSSWRLYVARRENEKLETLVTQRTGALNSTMSELRATQVSLEQSNQELASASRAKSAFLANMSHEIRTPLNAVVGMASLLQGMPLDSEQREYVETIRGSADLLLGLLNDVLDISKIEAGRLVLERIEFDVRRVLEEAILQVAGPAFSKGLELALVVDREVPGGLLGDPTRLRQVVLNLVSNAVKFTSRGEVVVQVIKTGTRYRIDVSDTGIGIPSHLQDSLFNTFTQADASTTRRFGGTGLGLSICKALVHAMGGDIHLASTVGAGSTFSVSLPCAPCESFTGQPVLAGRRIHVSHVHDPTRQSLVEALARLGAQRAERDTAELWLSDEPPLDDRPWVRPVKLGVTIEPAEGARVPTGLLTLPVRAAAVSDTLLDALGKASTGAPLRPADTRFLGKRVLVAEDNSINQRVAIRMLERLGVAFQVVGDGAQAVAAVKNSPFDLILMDCQMPVLDGYEATKVIRSLDGPAAHVSIVAVTASAREDDRAKCLAVGINDYLAKPLHLAALEATLLRWLGHPQ